MAKLPLFDQLTRLAYALAESVKRNKVNADTFDGLRYQNTLTDIDDYSLRNAVAIVDLTLFDNLSAHACRYLLNIIRDMKMNNVFYIIDETTANTRRSLAELKRYEILLATERKGLYIINPFKLRRGKPLSTIMASLHHFTQDNSIKFLTDLRPPKAGLIT